MKAAYVVLLATLLCSYAFALTFQVEPKTSDCFYQEAKVCGQHCNVCLANVNLLQYNDEVEATYHVTRGGLLDVDVKVLHSYVCKTASLLSILLTRTSLCHNRLHS